MNRYGLSSCLGVFLAFSGVAAAQENDIAAEISAAEQGCLNAAQQRYGAAEEKVSLQDQRVKWDSGLKGYKVIIGILQDNGKTQNYICVARKGGKFKFFNT